MIRKIRIGTAAVAPCIVLGLSFGSAFAKDPPLLSLTAEHFSDTATVTDAPLDAKATISTERGFVESSGPLHMVWHDEFLSADIDKNTGQKSFRVHALITYKANWRFYETATYQTPSGPKTVQAAQVSKEGMNCAVGDCLYTEHVAFPVDEPLLRELAAANVPGHPDIWPYKVIAKSGSPYAGGLSSAEIAGLLRKVDEYTGTPVLLGASAAAPTARLDLGVAGLPVAATAEQPHRAGILIIAVTQGGVAHKAGIIVGDILCDFDGRPIKTLAELHAAIAAGHGNSAVPIRLYRGTETMAVTAQF
jgi:hypothetical protein